VHSVKHVYDGCPEWSIASGLPSGGIFKFLLRFLTVTEVPDRAHEDDQIIKMRFSVIFLGKYKPRPETDFYPTPHPPTPSSGKSSFRT